MFSQTIFISPVLQSLQDPQNLQDLRYLQILQCLQDLQDPHHHLLEISAQERKGHGAAAEDIELAWYMHQSRWRFSSAWPRRLSLFKLSVANAGYSTAHLRQRK